MQLRHGHVVFYVLNLFALFFLKVGGVWKHFLIHDAFCMMYDAGYTLLNAVPPPPSLWSYRLCLRNRLFCTCAHAWCHIHFFHHVKFYFRFGQLIAFPVSGQLCCYSQGKESSTFFSGNMKWPLHCNISPFWGSSSLFRLSAFIWLSSFFWSSSYFRSSLFSWTSSIFNLIQFNIILIWV